jgi:hypothetical protein
VTKLSLYESYLKRDILYLFLLLSMSCSMCSMMSVMLWLCSVTIVGRDLSSIMRGAHFKLVEMNLFIVCNVGLIKY